MDRDYHTRPSVLYSVKLGGFIAALACVSGTVIGLLLTLLLLHLSVY